MASSKASLDRQRFSLDAVLEGIALHQFHGDEGLAALLVDIVDGADVGMIQRRGGPGLALEALEGLLVIAPFLRAET